jgi:tRNA nucleotidyltransferase (CCA-adding enzyme)
MSTFALAYDLVKSIVESKSENYSTLSKLLLRNTDEKYLAWVSAALMPWADAPQPPSLKPSKKRPLHASVLVAQEGFKAPNTVCNIIASSVDHMEEIKKLVDECFKGLRSSTGTVPDDATARDTLGMAIRRWGSTWRSQILFSLIHETVSGQVSEDRM